MKAGAEYAVSTTSIKMEYRAHVLLDNGLDADLDTRGVTLKTRIMCGDCHVELDHIGKDFFRCPSCGMTYQA